MRELIEQAVEKFNERARKDEKLGRELEGIERKVLVDLKDGPKFHFVLKDRQIGPVGEGAIEAPDVTIVSDSSTLSAVLRKEMGPMKAYATQKLKVKASLDDVLRLRKFF
ncbi:MAG TPA: SCP2 sterol-binding domain-containing protein [Thermoplasmata archaeon]|jgi:putative sterol carrier protein|nr:SCP2 sterol-binding domain-containing protein [Thermoplasmata archaeon]